MSVLPSSSRRNTENRRRIEIFSIVTMNTCLNTYLITVEIEPLEPITEKFIVTLEMQSILSDLDEIEDRFAGSINSPIRKIMDEKGIDIVKNFEILRIEDILNPNTNYQPKLNIAGRTKKFSDCYGYWITDTGELIEVLDACGHDKVRNTNYAYDSGWIALVTCNDYDMSIRFHDDRVTNKALKTLLSVINKSNYPTYYSDFGLKSLDKTRRMLSKVDVINQIKKLLKC